LSLCLLEKNKTIFLSSPNILATSVIFKKLSVVNNCPIGENSSNQVTLSGQLMKEEKNCSVAELQSLAFISTSSSFQGSCSDGAKMVQSKYQMSMGTRLAYFYNREIVHFGQSYLQFGATFSR
jgi:hypothetical protein